MGMPLQTHLAQSIYGPRRHPQHTSNCGGRCCEVEHSVTPCSSMSRRYLFSEGFGPSYNHKMTQVVGCTPKAVYQTSSSFVPSEPQATSQPGDIVIFPVTSHLRVSDEIGPLGVTGCFFPTTFEHTRLPHKPNAVQTARYWTPESGVQTHDMIAYNC